MGRVRERSVNCFLLQRIYSNLSWKLGHSLVGSYLQREESHVLPTVGQSPESGLFLRKSSWPWMKMLVDRADLQGKIMSIPMLVLLSGADREVCVCRGLEMPPASNISSVGSINKSDHKARGRRGAGDRHEAGVPKISTTRCPGFRQCQGKQAEEVPINQGESWGEKGRGQQERLLFLLV